MQSQITPSNYQGTQPHAPPESLRTRLAGLASQLCEVFDIQHLLDYRCGADPIALALRVGHAMKIQIYEPKFERYAAPPIPAEFVFYCADDLIEDEEGIEALMRTLSALAAKCCVVGVPQARLERGVWLTIAMRYFEINTFQAWEQGFFIIGYPMEESVQLLS